MKTLALLFALAFGMTATEPQLVIIPVAPSCSPSPCTPNPTGGVDLFIHSFDAGVLAYSVVVTVRDSQGHEANFDARAAIVRDGWARLEYLWDRQKFPIAKIEIIALREAFRRTEVQ